jgi:Protein of unknown function (DUF1153)
VRWTPKRKAALVRKFVSGSKREVTSILKAEGVSEDEFRSWQRRFSTLGINGLRVSKVARPP